MRARHSSERIATLSRCKKRACVESLTHVAMSAVALWTCALLALASARIYERCDLARDLQSLGVEQEHLSTWVCIAYHESRYDTAANNPHSGDHGILQISQLYWCGPGKVCGVPCSNFRDDDITDDFNCAQKIHKEHTRLQGDGFLAWVVYPQHCKHNTKKYLVDCDSTYHKDATPIITDPFRSLTNDNNQNFSYHIYPQVDEQGPPYLSITTLLFKTNNNKLGERRDHKQEKTNYWYDYKFENIDKLKLPVLQNRPTYKTTTKRTTTTTTSRPAVAHKQIDTMHFDISPFSPPKTIELKTSPRTQQLITTKAHSTSIFKFNHLSPFPAKAVTYEPNPVTVATIKPSTSGWRFSISRDTFTPARTATKFTPQATEATSRALASTPRPTSTKLLPLVVKSHADRELPFIFTTTTPSTTLRKSTKTTLSRSSLGTKKFPFIYKSRKEEKYSTSIRSTTSTTKVMPFIFFHSGTQSSKTSTPRPKPVTTQKFTFATLTTTPRTIVTRSTYMPKTSPYSRTIQSLFDLYLNPTKRTELAPYSVPQKNNSYSIKIFSGGTTTPVPTFQSRDKKTL